MDVIGIILSSSSSSSPSSDDDEPIVQIVSAAELLKQCPKNEQFSETMVALFDDNEFKQHFRVPRKVVSQLASLLKESESYPKCSTGFEIISSEKCMQIFLWFVGHEAVGFRDVADKITISKLHNIIEVVSHFVSGLSKNVITWPTDEEQLEITENFKTMGFPNVLGVIDGSYIKIDTPSEDPVSYYNRKKYYSVHMQAVCDDRKRFRDIFIGFPGSIHDSRVFRNSSLSASLEEKCGENYILGDSAYPCLRNLLTPYKYRENLSVTEKEFNKKLSHCRVVIEHAFGMLKQKFRMMYHVKITKIENICHLIRACCVLHNLAIDEDINWDQTDEATVADNLMMDEDDEENNEVRNEPGHAFRNYIASILNVQFFPM